MSIPTLPPTFYEFAFNAAPNQNQLPSLWQDLSARVQFPWTVARGRQYELDTNETGTWNVVLANPDGALDPSNAASPFAPNLMLYRGCRIRCQPGANLLTPDQANCGQSSPYPAGPVPGQLGVTNDFGYPVSLAPSGTAYTGSQVYQVTLPPGSGTFTTIVILPVVSVVPGNWYSATAEVVITSGSSVACDVALIYYAAGGTQLSATAGTSKAVTSGSTSWTTLTASAQAPTGTTWAQYAVLKVELSGSVSAATTFQVGALQLEQSLTPTPWQQPFTVQRNLLPQAIATGAQSINPATDSPSNYFYAAVGSIAQARFLTAAPSGHTTALAWTVPSGTTAPGGPLYVGVSPMDPTTAGPPVQDVTQVTGGVAYTVSCYLSRLASADGTIQVTAGLCWFDVNGNPLTTSAGTAVTVPTSGWARVTCTASAPAGAVWGRARIYITTPTTTTAQNTIYATGWQVEANSSASTWTDPGPTYFLFTGSYERMPQTWTEQQGTYGTAEPIGVDAFAGLSQPILLDPFVNEVLALGPNLFYQLNDPAGATSCVDSSGRRPAAPVENSSFGPGSLTFGSSITSTATTGGFVGSSGPVATFANNPSDAAPFQFPETFVNLAKTTVMPGPPTSGSWTRLIAFRAASIPAAGSTYHLWAANPASWSGSNLSTFSFVLLGSTGFLQMALVNAALVGYVYNGASNLCDGNWHLAAIGADPAGGGISMFIDGVQVVASGSAGPPTGIAVDVVGALVVAGKNQASDGAVADIAHVIEFPFKVSAAQMTNLYNSWRTASAGESSGARFQRVLNWVGYTGPTSIATGSTSSMGPATDNKGAAALDALNNITLTENGDQYASSAGVLTFKARSNRYNQRVPLYTFGEGAPVGNAGEWPCEISQLEYDSSLLGNDMQITRYSPNSIYYASDATSQANYYQRTYQRTINTTSGNEPQDAANYLLSQYKDPHMRVDVIHLHPSAMPGLMNACLQLEKGVRIRVIRRPDGAPEITLDCFVEKLDWSWDPNSGDVTLEVQASPANLVNYWTLGALHTTLGAQAASGQNTATINALPDSAVNALSQSLPQGYQLTFDPGTAIAETMTIAPPLPATTIGYQSAVLTFTTNFQFTHAAGAVVCEPLPAGYASPTTWDQASLLGAASTTLNAAAAAAQNQIVVNALSDSTTNAITSNWNVGDLLWISPGTPDFEGYNLLTPNQSTAGGGVLPLAGGTAGSAVGLGAFYGTPTVTSSGSAFQGSTVWQTSVAGSAATGHTLINVMKVAITPGLPYTFSVYVRSATSGANPQVNAQLGYIGGPTTNGSTVTLTGSSSAAWTRLTATATAPAGVSWATLGVNLSSAPSGAWGFQADALQLEQNPSASAYQTCPQIQSVAASVPGYSSAVITLANPLADNHALGDVVCDPLPPGTTSPPSVSPTTRIAY